MPSSRNQDESFATTLWPMIQQARRDPAALAEVVEAYRPALRTFLLRRFRLQENDTEDLLQDFLVRKRWLQDFVDLADPQRGQFRQLLARSVGNFVRDALRSPHGPTRQMAGLEGYDLADEREEDSIDASWAEALVGDAIEGMFETCRREQSQWKVWNVFKARYLESEPWTGDQIARTFGLTKGQVDGAARAGRQAFREQLLRRLGEQGGGAAGEEALEELHAAVCRHDRIGQWRRTGLAYLIDQATVVEPSCFSPPTESEPRVKALFEEARTEDQGLRQVLHQHLRELGIDAQGTLVGLLTAAAPGVDLLDRVKDLAKERRVGAADRTTQEVWTWVYIAAVAVALVRRGERISRKPDAELRANFEWAQGHGWGNAELANVLAAAPGQLGGR